MELIFKVDSRDGVVMRASGEVIGHALEARAKNQRAEITVRLRLTEYCVEVCEDTTKIIPVPGAASGHLRIYGASKFDIAEGILEVTFQIKSFHESYESACACEMEDIMKAEAEHSVGIK